MTKTYKLTPAFFSTLQTGYYTIVIPLVLLSFLLMLLIPIIGFEIRIGTIILGLFWLFFVAWGLLKALAQQRKTWSSYLLVIDNDSIKRVLNPGTIVEISKSEISRIREYPNGNIYIESQISKKGILIPSAIENYPEIQTLLFDWHQFESAKSNRPINIVIILFVVVSMALVTRIFYTGDNKVVSITIGVVLLLVFAGTTVYAYNKSTNRRSRRVLWWMLLPTAGVVLRLYALLFSK